jgi:hypothetical protein
MSSFKISNTSANTSDKLTNMSITASERAPAPASNSPPQTSVGNAHIFYFKPNGGKIFLGTAENRTKLAHFSNAARDQLIKIDPQIGKLKNMGNDREVIISPVDYDAGRLVLNFINENAIHTPKQLSSALLPTNCPLSFTCKVVQACNAFRIPRELRGDEIRKALLSRTRGLRYVTLADFQNVCENVHFDAGLVHVTCNKVAFHTWKKWISEHELACIWEYINLPATAYLGLVAKMEEVWDEVWLKAPEEEQDAFREEHGLQVVVLHRSVAGAPLVLSSGPKKPILKINTGSLITHKVPEPVDQRLPSDDHDKPSTTAAVENKVGGSKAALSLAQVKAAPSLAQQKASESNGADDKDKKAAAPVDKKAPARQFSYAKALGNNSGA